MARVFSGIQPSGELHIGNYLGAVQRWVALQSQYQCFICIVDYHAITQDYDRSLLQQRALDMAIGLLAAGIDPERTVLFVQSHVMEHAELAWVFTSVTPVGELERMTQFKDKSQRQESVLAGLMNYPVLQAADGLLYKADPAQVERALRRVLPRAQGPGGRREANRGPRWRGQDVEEPGEYHRCAGRARRHLASAPPGQDRPGSRHQEGPRQPRHLQHLRVAQVLLAQSDGGRGGPQVPHRGLGLPRLQ